MSEKDIIGSIDKLRIQMVDKSIYIYADNCCSYVLILIPKYTQVFKDKGNRI